MTAPTPYLALPGNARDALSFYQSVFGGDLTLHDYAEFGRRDGPDDAIAHGQLDGPVALFASDAGADDDALNVTGLMLSLLGSAEPDVLTRWFDALADRGRVISPLEKRPWGDHDGSVRDQFGVCWLIGFEG